MSQPTFRLLTFGCKSNQYESQAIRELLINAGFTETTSSEQAKILVANTCGVTGRAGASCRNAIRKAMRANPDMRVVITGCGVDLEEKWPDLPSGAPLLIPNAKKHALPLLLGQWLDHQPPSTMIQEDRFNLAISSFADHTRAFLKIQDGCDNFCSYCAVPHARGKPESRSAAAVLDEAKRLVDAGHGELVLTGINIAVYRRDGRDFADLAAELAETPGLERLRLGSIEPPQMTEKLVEQMRSSQVICPHVHLPLQSGSDRILAAMGRRYDSALFLEKVALLQSRLPQPAITTDIIVGFPGEDREAFAASMAVCRQAGFSRLHVFLFSPRPGTPAATMRRDLPDRTIESWKTELITLGETLAEQYAAACVGLTERVIAERSAKGVEGLSDRYVRVRLDNPDHRLGDVIRVRIVSAAGQELRGRKEAVF